MCAVELVASGISTLRDTGISPEIRLGQVTEKILARVPRLPLCDQEFRNFIEIYKALCESLIKHRHYNYLDTMNKSKLFEFGCLRWRC